MEQIIIIAPPEIDVSEAVKILKSAQVEVSVVAPSPANFLHFALGMIPDHPNDGQVNTENDDSEKPEADETTEKDTDDAAVDKVDKTQDDEDKKSDEKPATEVTADDDVSIGECIVNGEKVKAFLTSGPSYIEVVGLTRGPRNAFSINESSFSFWFTDGAKTLSHSFGVSRGGTPASVVLEVKNGTTARVFLSADIVAKLK